MAVTAKWYGQALLKALNKEVDWDSDTIKVMLCTALTIDQDGDVYMSDVTKTEVSSGNGYTTGGATLGSKTIDYTAGTNVIKLDAADTVWSNSSITAAYAVIYVSTGSAATDVLLGYVDFGGNVVSSSGNFTIAWHSDGIFTITPA
jgi:hypothetical protein